MKYGRIHRAAPLPDYIGQGSGATNKSSVGSPVEMTLLQNAVSSSAIRAFVGSPVEMTLLQNGRFSHGFSCGVGSPVEMTLLQNLSRLSRGTSWLDHQSR